jgi:hypothetical protein
MAILRQQFWRGQQRVDVPHLRAIESGVAGDFDVLAGNLIAGRVASVAKGFQFITTGITGIAATALQLKVAGSILVHYEASETGSVFQVPSDRAPEVLSTSNSRVSGGWTFNTVNYVGIDLVRSADSTTADTLMILDPTTNQEVPQIAPLARTLDYKIVISTTNFSATPGIAPVAKVSVSSTGTVSGVAALTDCRSMLFSLASGGDSPSETNVYSWPNGRTPGTAFYNGGDKGFSSLKDWMQGIMSRVWELGGGEKWYSQTADRNVILCFETPTVPKVENFTWTPGTSTVTWEKLSVLFDNSTATSNTITDGSALLTADGQCIYVDLNRTVDNTALTMQTGTLATLSGGSTPGSRFVIAVRRLNKVFVRNNPWEVGYPPYGAAEDISYGVVQMTKTRGGGVSRVPFVDLASSYVAICGGISRKDGIAAMGAGDLLIGLGAANDDQNVIIKTDTAYSTKVLGNTTAVTSGTIASLKSAPLLVSNENAAVDTLVASFWGKGAVTQFAGGFASEGSILVPKVQGTPSDLYSDIAATNGLGCSVFVRKSPANSKKLQLCIKWPTDGVEGGEIAVLAESGTYP